MPLVGQLSPKYLTLLMFEWLPETCRRFISLSEVSNGRSQSCLFDDRPGRFLEEAGFESEIFVTPNAEQDAWRRLKQNC